MFLCIYSACAKVISTNSIILEKMDSMDESTIENSKLSWREITVRSGKMEDYSNMTRSISLKKVNIIGTSSIIQGLKMMVFKKITFILRTGQLVSQTKATVFVRPFYRQIKHWSSKTVDSRRRRESSRRK